MVTTTTVGSVCPKCGTIGKSGKRSCCGRGGSWYRNCGSAGNTKRRHTWYEGMQTCKAREQLKTISGQESNAAQHANSSNDIYTTNSKTVVTAAKTFTLTSSNTLTPMSSLLGLLLIVYILDYFVWSISRFGLFYTSKLLSYSVIYPVRVCDESM